MYAWERCGTRFGRNVAVSENPALTGTGERRLSQFFEAGARWLT
jgi:hypothetical protein